MTMHTPVSRLVGWCWADGNLTRAQGALTARRGGAVHLAFLAAAEAAGRTATSKDVWPWRVRLTVAGPLPRLPEVRDPLAALASIIECEGSRGGKILDDRSDARLDEAQWLLQRVLPAGSWRRVSWTGGGGALFISSPEGLAKLAEAPFVDRTRLPVRVSV